jgi:hypothetical protein
MPSEDGVNLVATGALPTLGLKVYNSYTKARGQQNVVLS